MLLLEKYLGKGDPRGKETAWINHSEGRVCLVYFQEWPDGSGMVTTFDTARAANQVSRMLTVSGDWGLRELERELVSLTTPPTPRPAKV